jgi:serine/threonine protein kinase
VLSAPAGRARHRRFAAQLLGALRFMAQQRVVHCDLKPENILLVEPNKARIKARAGPRAWRAHWARCIACVCRHRKRLRKQP